MILLRILILLSKKKKGQEGGKYFNELWRMKDNFDSELGRGKNCLENVTLEYYNLNEKGSTKNKNLFIGFKHAKLNLFQFQEKN